MRSWWCSVLRRCGCAGWRGGRGTGGVALSTPKSPAVKLEADFRPREPGAQRLGASWGRADKCRWSRTAQREPAVRAAAAETGEPAGRGLTTTGPGRSHWARADGERKCAATGFVAADGGRALVEACGVDAAADLGEVDGVRGQLG